jgi:hypothetical protein
MWESVNFTAPASAIGPYNYANKIRVGITVSAPPILIMILNTRAGRDEALAPRKLLYGTGFWLVASAEVNGFQFTHNGQL